MGVEQGWGISRLLLGPTLGDEGWMRWRLGEGGWMGVGEGVRGGMGVRDRGVVGWGCEGRGWGVEWV